MHRAMTLSTALVWATLALLGMHGNISAGESTPNVTGKWEGTWNHRAGSGQITIQLAQEGPKVIGKPSVVSGDSMTGTACGYTCATLKLKKAAF